MIKLSTYYFFKTYKHCFCLLAVFFLVETGYAQVEQQHPSIAPETAFLHLAKTGYVTGELIWYKIYVLSTSDRRLSLVSKIAYVDVLQEDGVSVFQQKIEIENGSGDGSWLLPSTLPTGNYTVRCYVSAQKSYPASIYTTSIQVINPSSSSFSNISLKDTSNYSVQVSVNNKLLKQHVNNSSLTQEESIFLSGLQKIYSTRSKVNLNVTLPKSAAELSVTVYKLDGLELLQQQSFDLTTTVVKQSDLELIYKANATTIYPSEYSGHFVTGTVVDRQTGKPISGVPVYLSVSGERFYFGKATSNQKGAVRFDIGKPYGSKQIVVQLPQLKDSNAIVQIDAPFAGVANLEKSEGSVSFNGNKKQLEERVFYATVDQSFDASKTSTYILPHFTDSTVFYGMPDKTYYLDDYTRFNTMEEVFREYVVEVDLRKSNLQYKFAVLDIPNKKSFENNPLVLIDGVPTSDINKVVAFDPLKVKRMDIVSRKFFLGDQTYDGIISLITYNGDLGGYELDKHTLVVDYPGIPMKRQYNGLQYLDKVTLNRKLPDLRVLLHWEPYLKLSRNQSKSVAFYTADLEGDYVIEFKGVSENGRILTQQHYFSVVK
jgi:hypothetical protein